MTDESDHGQWEPWAHAVGEAKYVWDAFWAALPRYDHDVPDGVTDEVNRLLTANPHLAEELPLLGELIWHFSPAFPDPDYWTRDSGSVLRRMAELLVAHGCDLEQRRHEGLTPLMMAAERGNVDMVEFLIASGSRLQARDEYGKNVLHFAADGRDLHMMALCLNAGLDPNLADDEGRTPLLVLFDGSYPSRPELVSVLLSHGASANAHDHLGRSSLHLLAQSSDYDVESLRLLVAAGANPFAVAEDGSTPWSVASGNDDETFRTVVRDAAHTGDLGSLAIFEREAVDLIRRGEAGCFSFFADNPRPHPKQLCVHAENQWFLLPPSVAILVRADAQETDADDEFYTIRFADPEHPVAAMIGREREQFGPSKITSSEIAEEFVGKMLRFHSRLPK